MSPPPLLLHVYATFAIGGSQVRFAAIANRFGRRWRHAIVAMDGNIACRERLSPDLDVAFPDMGVRKGQTLSNVRHFRAALREMKPRALVTSNWGSIEWAMANALPLVRHVHVEDGFGPEERITQIPRRVWTRRLLLRRAEVVVPSHVLWRIATGMWRLDARHVHYVPNGIDLSRFRMGVRVGEKELVIGTVAALRAEKNVARLLRAFRLFSESGTPARLVIAGDGPERPGLEALARELGIARMVDFTGHVLDPSVLHREIDVFALSSDTEQMPISVLEAMAAGLPVAATNVGDIRAMLARENDAFVTPLDAPGGAETGLAAAFAVLAADPDRRRAIGAANRARAERDFDDEAMFRAYADLWDGTESVRG